MIYYAIKIILTVTVVVAIAEIAKRNSAIAAAIEPVRNFMLMSHTLSRKGRSTYGKEATLNGQR
jgi:hypothetical protein